MHLKPEKKYPVRLSCLRALWRFCLPLGTVIHRKRRVCLKRAPEGPANKSASGDSNWSSKVPADTVRLHRSAGRGHDVLPSFAPVTDS